MALVKSDGTLLAKAPGGTVLETQAEADPKVKVLINVYEDTPYDGVDYPTQMKQLRYRAGQIVSLAEWNAEFATPTITSVTPAAAAAAGGTALTVVGTGFTTAAAPALGGTACTSIVVKNDKLITCVSPAKTAGTYDFTVVTAAGTATKTGAVTTS